MSDIVKRILLAVSLNPGPGANQRVRNIILPILQERDTLQADNDRLREMLSYAGIDQQNLELSNQEALKEATDE